MVSNRRLNVLLVDDDEEDFLIIRDLLSDIPGRPVSLEWEGNYDKAMAIIATQSHDAYLIDYRLGLHTGMDLMIATENHRAASKPLILLTGKGDQEIDERAMQLGAADYLVKSQLSGPLLERSISYAIRRAEYIQELKEREDAARSIFDATFEGILVLDIGGRILDLNQPAARSLGEPRAKLIDTSIFDFFPTDAGNRLLATTHEVAPKTFKTVVTAKDSKSVHLEVSAKSYMFRGQPAILVACEDISERMQMEAQILQQDRLASVGLLASSLAHEIGTPLGVMRGRAEIILMHAEPDSSAAKNANIIVSQIDRISKLIHSLLNLARGDKTARDGKVDVAHTLSDVLDLMGHEFNRNKIEVENKIPEGTWVRANSGPLHQVFLNLLVNALHAMQTAVKQGRAEGHRVQMLASDDGAYVHIHISDTGCGISEANLKQLFKPFFTTKDIGVGTGLGLATSYRILESWNASIGCKSQEGKGTTFTLRLVKA